MRVLPKIESRRFGPDQSVALNRMVAEFEAVPLTIRLATNAETVVRLEARKWTYSCGADSSIHIFLKSSSGMGRPKR
jgi:hypothetical protein